jgi:glycine/D-amino acid oxidase-like deaminating enzyme
MNSFDWIVVGAGITGAALSYELAKQGLSVLLLEQDAQSRSATRFSYGGIAYWSGTTKLTRILCAEGIAIYRSLSAELEGDTQFREVDLLLTIPPEADPQAAAEFYSQFALPPQLLDVAAACELEPLLNPAAIGGALTVKHGHIDTQATAEAYIQTFQRLGGKMQIDRLTQLVREENQRVTGVTCMNATYACANVAICAGAWSRSLLKAAGIPVPIYFTQGELIDVPSPEIRLQTIVMPAETKRFQLEAAATAPELTSLWDEPGYEVAPPILDAGAVQFQDGRLRIGQISRTLTDRDAVVDASASEQQLRSEVGKILPALQSLPGTWQQCAIAFSHDRLPLIGAVSEGAGVHLFSGFSNPLAIVPPLARRFAAQATGQPDDLLRQLSPERWVLPQLTTP